ncbi:uncharacterized protein PHALS_02267 [Plasmopara halstedii]|uniref:Uncharacterized protein n=1 Tax=Plasmopara halstedii TaxID=4781 RepID=A0A0P1AW37_PLAHL|nr:uncharacterized protein PHALS_02267 [Plasmopara halstedii]CEG45934.1 hypothetical protein PHALS_02267 [Plasmopara halstedii]|eukprot:XP_024582303.1 hypothetical protein PHALS_02267 [Plasmopara halstedii]
MDLSPDLTAEVTRLRHEVNAKEEALNALKTKTKAFVDNMRSQLANETQKAIALEAKLKEATAASNASSLGSEQQRWTEEIERLKKETNLRENDLKSRAKSYADAMTSQLESEKKRCRELETLLQQKTEALDAAKTIATPTNELDFFSQPVIATGSHTDDEFHAVQSQLSSANFEMADLREQLRNVEAGALQSTRQAENASHELETLRGASEQQCRELQSEVNSLRARESSLQAQLQATESRVNMDKICELELKIQQHKTENHSLQNQLIDKDFQLEQLDNYRRRADDSETKVLQHQAEINVLQTKLSSYSCNKCNVLEEKLAEITQLYEKVNLGRSRSDSLIAETQSQLGELQTIKQQYVASQDRVDDLMKQNLKLNEKVTEKEIQVANLKAELQKSSTELADLKSQHNALMSDSTQHRQLSESIHVDLQKVEETRNELQAKCINLDKKNKELTTAIESINKENTDKRQKAKALVQTLVGEKTSLLEARSHLQKEVDRLRMEVNQRNVDNDQQLKTLRDETNEKAAENLITIQSLTDEVAKLKRTLTTVQESEKVQQRAKELAAAKREIEDSNKKRLAAKAETQKLAVELENMHRCLDHITTHVNAVCTDNFQQIALVQGHVKEALEVLKSRAGSGAQNKKVPEEDPTIKVEALSDIRCGNTQQNPGAKRLEENVSRVSEQIRQLVDITEQFVSPRNFTQFALKPTKP